MDEQKNTPESQAPERRSELEMTKRLKRVILLILAGMILFVSLYYGLMNLLVLLEKNKEPEYNPTPQTIIFHTPDYTENIYTDKSYMQLDRDIYYHNVNTGITEAIDLDAIANSTEIVRFMVRFINHIIKGEEYGYNRCFSNYFYEEYSLSDNIEKEAFTMQKLYNIKFTLLSESEDDSTGITEYIVLLEYMIFKNNGTFRTDVGSDAIKPQYLVITDRTDNLLIDSITYAKAK